MNRADIDALFPTGLDPITAADLADASEFGIAGIRRRIRNGTLPEPTVRYEKTDWNYLAFVLVASIMVLLR